MPRPATTNHPLRQVREILGITQIELAKRVGCSPVTIKKIENRKLIPGEKLIRRLAAETDVHSHILLDPEARLTDRQGKPLSREAHEEKVMLGRLISAKKVSFFVRMFSMMIEALLDASLEPAQPKIHHVFNALCDTLNELKADFDLDAEVEKILPNPNPLLHTWAVGIAIAAEQKKIPLKLDPKARQQRYQKRRETIELKKDVSPKKPSRLPLSRGSDSGGKTS
jgi:transcriptional regulator with XRE-family HTH domain